MSDATSESAAPRAPRKRTASHPVYPPRRAGRVNRGFYTRQFTLGCNARAAAIGYLVAAGKIPIENETFLVELDTELGGWRWRELEPEPELPIGESAAETATRKPAPLERRQVLRRMDDYWSYEAGRWRTGWSDSIVAGVLGVPVAWVADLRLAMFDAPDANEDEPHADLIAEARRAAEAALAAAVKAERAAQALEAAGRGARA